MGRRCLWMAPNISVLFYSWNSCKFRMELLVWMDKMYSDMWGSWKKIQVWILCFKFPLNPHRFSLAQETDIKISRAKSWENFETYKKMCYTFDAWQFIKIDALGNLIKFCKLISFSLGWKINLKKSSLTNWIFNLFPTGFLLPV